MENNFFEIEMLEDTSLTLNQKILAVYRMIIELKEINNSNELSEETLKIIISLMETVDYKCGILKTLMLYLCIGNDQKYRDIMKESVMCYNKLLNKYKDLALELNLKNALEISILFTYMLWNGYYSVTKEHSYKLQGRLLIPGLYSFDVIRGNGVCLAYAQLLSDYLNVCSKKSSFISCTIPSKENAIVRTYMPPIQRKYNSNIKSEIESKVLNFVFKGVVKKTGNHVITLIEEDDKFYGYDATNFYVLSLKDENTASLINGEGNYHIHPLNSLISYPYADNNRLYEKILEQSSKKVYTRKEIIFDYENIIEFIKENVNLLDDAYIDIHSHLEIINNKTNKILKNRRNNF